MRGRALLHGGQALHEALRRARAVQRGALGQQLAPARAPPAFATSNRAPAPLALRPPGWPPHAPLRAVRRGGAHARALPPSIAALHRLGAAPGAVPCMAC